MICSKREYINYRYLDVQWTNEGGGAIRHFVLIITSDIRIPSAWLNIMATAIAQASNEEQMI